MNKALLTMSLAAATLMGCAPATNDRAQMLVEVNATQQRIQIENTTFAQLEQTIARLVTHYGYDLARQHAVIEWNDAPSKRFAMEAAIDLNKLGFESKVIHRGNAVAKNSITVAFNTQSSQVDVCRYLTADQIASDVTGCYVESNRWLSIVNPQNMILAPKLITTEADK